MTLPNLVIGGAPKCGTSSLFRWLVDHPHVCGSTVKEPFFFMDRDNPLRRGNCNFHDHGIEAYEKFFPACTAEHKVIVEASTHYLYQSTALEILPSLPSNPRLIFLVRKPSERVFSSFAYSKNKGNLRSDLSFPDFLRMIRCQSSPITAPDWAWRASAYVLPRDIEYCRYINYLSSWRERLGGERMRVIVLEAMRADSKGAVQELCSWLGIDSAFYDGYDFAPHNRTSPLRSPFVQKMAVSLSNGVRSGPLKEAIKRIYYAVQSAGQMESRSEEDKAALIELDEEFRPYNERLAREFGLNLSPWE